MTSSAPAEAFVWIHLPGAPEPVVAGRVYRAAGDICPQGRAGNEATQAMLIVGSNRMSQLKVCLDAAPLFQLSIQQANH